MCSRGGQKACLQVMEPPTGSKASSFSQLYNLECLMARAVRPCLPHTSNNEAGARSSDRRPAARRIRRREQKRFLFASKCRRAFQTEITCCEPGAFLLPRGKGRGFFLVLCSHERRQSALQRSRPPPSSVSMDLNADASCRGFGFAHVRPAGSGARLRMSRYFSERHFAC